MVKRTYDLKSYSLRQGTIDDAGAEQSATDCVRCNGLTGDPSLCYVSVVEGEALALLPWSGSTDGDDDLKIPSADSGHIKTSYYDNPNYRVEYYWWTIERPTYDDGHGGHYTRVGAAIVVYPVEGGNATNDKPYVRSYQNVAYSGTSGSSTLSISGTVDYIDIAGNTITYTDGGITKTTTCYDAFLPSVITRDSSDIFSGIYKAARESQFIDLEFAILGYRTGGAASLLANVRWESADSQIDFSRYLIDTYRFVLRYDEGVPLLVRDITKATVAFSSDEWYLADDIIINTALPDPIDGDIFTPPYPASFWYYDRRLRRLNNMLLPDELHSHSGINHDYTDGTEYFNTYTEKYINALKNKYNTYRIRLELLTDDETAIGEITKDLSLSAQGQITINYEKITRRSCSLTLINVEKKYIPTKNSPFWLNRKFKLWIGLVVDTDTYWWSEGVYYTVSAHATGRTLEIEGIDKGGALDGTLKLNMTESQYKFGRNVLVSEIIKRTLSLDIGSPVAGIWAKPMVYGGNRPIDSVPPLISTNYFGFKTVADITVDANNYISSLFEQLADLYAADCYYDTEGHFVFEPHIDSSGYNYVPTQWKFDDLSSTFEDVEYEYSFDGENVVTVYTNTTSAGVANVSWTAYNTNPLSPLNVGTGMRRGEHIEIPYYDNTTPEQMVKDCRSAANHYLLAKSMVGMTLAFNSPIIPHMDVNKTIMINDQYADIEDGLYVVQSITIPLSGDKMSIEATNINWLPNDMRFSGISEIVEKSEGGAG